MSKVRDETFNYFYKDILRELFPLLIRTDSIKTLNLLIKNLNTAIENEISNEILTPEDDLSFYWRKLIDENENFPYSLDFKNNILNAIRDSLIFIGEKEKELLPKALEILGKNSYSIYYRLVLYTLHRFPELSKDYLFNTIFNNYYFYRINNNLEYNLLIEKFSNVEEIFKKYIELVEDQGVLAKLELNMKDMFGKNLSEENKKKYIKNWRIHRLSPLIKKLSDYQLDNLKITRRDLEHSNPLRLYQSKIQFGPISPIEKEKLLKMSIEEIVKYLKTFTESNDFFSESKTGLGRNLRDIVYARPNEFLTHLFRFIENDSISFYISYVFDGLNYIIKENKAILWEILFDFIKDILFNLKKDSINEKTFKDIKLSFNRLIHDGMSNNLIPLSFEEDIIKVLTEFLKDPYPTQKDEIKNIANNWFFEDMVFNTVRGTAMDTLISCAVWSKQNKLEGENYKDDQVPKLNPSIKEILISHLDVNMEKSYMIRYIYGMNFNKLIYIDEKFVLNHLNSIFPYNEEKINYWEAAWAGYIKFNNLFKKTFHILESEYKSAIKLISEEGLLTKFFGFSLENLTKHIMSMYVNNYIELNSKDCLIKEFFIRAPEQYRSIALIYIGQNLKEIKKFKDINTTLTNLKKLWDYRLDTARKSKIKYYSRELLGFYYWFTNSIFEEKWVLNKLFETTELTGGSIGVHYDILDKLLEFVDNNPIEVINSLNLIVKYEVKNNGYLLYIEKFRSLMEKIIISNNQEAIKTTKQLINFLGANYIHDLKDLINKT